VTAAATDFTRVTKLAGPDVAEGQVMQGVLPNGTTLVIGRFQGALFAAKDSCPHSEFPLSEGTLYPDGELECCWHGARFDCRTGEVRRGPAEDPLVRFEVEERDGGIWVRRAGR
jgi:3-phenylpropionate/trans-cinnamate dioxygenase ferredoxin component